MRCSAALTRPSWASSEPVTFSGNRHVKRRPLLFLMESFVAALLSAASSAAGPCRSTATMYLGSVTSVENEGRVSAVHTHLLLTATHEAPRLRGLLYTGGIPCKISTV